MIGMETEYATLIIDNDGGETTTLPASHTVYTQICEAIRRDQPAVAGVYDSEQMFLASGGAVTFESHPSMHATPGGLIEVATPEVRSPLELLACQRSIDALVADAAADIDLPIDLRVLKNSSDALGHVYGCQENYEAIVARGLWLLLYRMFICLLWVMQIVSLIVSLPIVAMMLSLVLVYRFFRGGLWRLARDPREMFELVPSWLTNLMIGLLRLIHLPTVMVLRLVAKRVAFRQQRRYLTAMLISRVAICGSGDLDHQGLFRLSAKAMAIDCVSDMGGYRGERPIFVYGHWLGQFCAKSFLSLSSTRRMLSKLQRFQIGLSDSNLSDLAEYVKVGSVSLLLDMIEAGVAKDLPIVKQPVKSLHRLTSDWNLVSRIATSRGDMSAIEIQKTYLKAAAEYVDSIPADHRGEAPLVIDRWRQLLDSIIKFRQDAQAVQQALGTVDWLTKRWMMDQLGDQADWSARKKVDLRYHELSDEGYYQQFVAHNPELRLIDDDQIARRRRWPPATSPAARRGWLIREFADSDESMQAEWTYAMIGRGRNRKCVHFVEAVESTS